MVSYCQKYPSRKGDVTVKKTLTYCAWLIAGAIAMNNETIQGANLIGLLMALLGAVCLFVDLPKSKS